MKLILVLFSSLALSATSICQVSSPQQIIRQVIDSGIWEGHDQKIIGPMGDAAAVTLTKVLGEGKLNTSKMDGILVILTGAFADVCMVPEVSDRDPQTALFILQYLKSATSDVPLNARIDETKSYILKQHENCPKKSSPDK